MIYRSVSLLTTIRLRSHSHTSTGTCRPSTSYSYH